MGGETWSLTAKHCDSCKTTPASVFCRADSAFLCLGCDSKIHAANKLASRHARVWLCEVCEQAPATVTCKADAAALCPTCDRDIHTANPLARRHDRIPVVPFYDSAAASKTHGDGDKFVNHIDINENDVAAEEEAEAASWLLPLPNSNPKGVDESPVEYLFTDLDPYLDMDLLSGDQKQQVIHHQHYLNSDGVVPVQNKNEDRQTPTRFVGPVVDGYPTFDINCSTGAKPFLYNFNSQSITQSISSSSLDVGVVPEHNAMADVSTGYPPRSEAVLPTPITGVDREARVLRYREKRKNRKFEKTIRYASRKAYAETRPRIKGRFAKRSTDQVEDVDSRINIADTSTYSVVPSY